MDLIFLTSNEEKFREAKEILSDFNIILRQIDLAEIQAIEGEEVVIQKAQAGFDRVGTSLIIEDTSLYINAWNQLPGALSKWFMKTVGNDGIVKMMSGFGDRSAVAETIIAYHQGEKIKTFKGVVSGTISDKPRGKNGFGWDKIFIPEGQTKTQAEMTSVEKNKISTRKIALEQLRTYLRSINND